MDPNKGTFHPVADMGGNPPEHGQEFPPSWPHFYIGERVQVRDTWFVITRINGDKVILRPEVAVKDDKERKLKAQERVLHSLQEKLERIAKKR